MNNDPNDLRFECAFSRKGINFNNRVCAIFSLCPVIPIIYLGVKTGWVWISIVISSAFILLCLYSLWYVNRLTNGSFLEITSDGILKCQYKGRKTVSYPIAQIRDIEAISLEEACSRFATFPVALNTHGAELYPADGVLITFNRAWIKSIFPVYFNPQDIRGFISAINQRTEANRSQT